MRGHRPLSTVNPIAATNSSDNKQPTESLIMEHIAQVFTFRTTFVTDESGNKVTDGNGNFVKKKIPSITLNIPQASAEEIIVALSEPGAVQSWLVAVINAEFAAGARAQINTFIEENPSAAEVGAEAVNLDELTFAKLAESAATGRSSSVPQDADYDAFAADYIPVIKSAAGKNDAQVKKHVALFKRAFTDVKNDRAVLAALMDLLRVWRDHTQAFGEHAAVYEHLMQKAQKFLTKESKQTIELI